MCLRGPTRESVSHSPAQMLKSRQDPTYPGMYGYMNPAQPALLSASPRASRLNPSTRLTHPQNSVATTAPTARPPPTSSTRSAAPPPPPPTPPAGPPGPPPTRRPPSGRPCWLSRTRRRTCRSRGGAGGGLGGRRGRTRRAEGSRQGYTKGEGRRQMEDNGVRDGEARLAV